MTLKKLHHNRHLFSVLSSSKPRLRRVILNNIDREFTKLISELCLNLTAGNVQLPDAIKKQTRQHQSIFRALSKRKTSQKQKRKHLVQAGEGFFTVLLPIIAGLVSNLLLSPSQS